MSRRILIIAALLAFMIALAIVIGTRLTGIAAAIGFGIAVGVSMGVPVGVGMAYAIHRWGLFPPEKSHYATWEDLEPGMLLLTPEQADALLGNLEQQPRSSASPRPPLDRSGHRDREFTVVGGGGIISRDD
jgi:hypothetical protein